MEFRIRMRDERYQWEAQYWWAFSCLVLAGRRTARDFHSQLLQRSAGKYPTPQEVEEGVDEALGNLAGVLNSALSEEGVVPRTGGWERHLLALNDTPEKAEGTAAED